MADQVRKVIELAERPNVSIRVIPFTAGWHHGVGSSFKIMDVADQRYVYTETTDGGRMIEKLDEVRKFDHRFRLMGDKALSTSDSQALMRQIEREYST